MAGYENKPGSGALFKNDKGDNPNRPDYRGDATLQDGSKVRISGWLKDGQKGKFLSLKIEAEDDRKSGSGGMGGGGSAPVAGGRGNDTGLDRFPSGFGSSEEPPW